MVWPVKQMGLKGSEVPAAEAAEAEAFSRPLAEPPDGTLGDFNPESLFMEGWVYWSESSPATARTRPDASPSM